MAELVVDVVILAACLVILVRSANIALGSLIRISDLTGLSHFSVGFVVLAVSTSIPELTVAVFSVSSGHVGITLGDIFGSNVTNLALVAPVFLLISPLRKIEKPTLRGFLPLLLVSSLIPVLLLAIDEGTQYVGVLLLAAFGFFVYHAFRTAPRVREEAWAAGTMGKPLLGFAVGIGLVLLSAKLIVDSAASIAGATGIRESVLGASIVALGTSLPELAVDIAAVRKRHLELALGDIVGSCLTNITLVLGIVLLLSDVAISFRVLAALVAFTIFLPLLLLGLLRRGQISTWQSAVLLAVYVTFVFSIYGVSFGA
jgi:cation:H+ antiporter